MVADYDVASGNVYSNTARYPIPDNNPTGASSVIDVTESAVPGSVKIEVNVSHTYVGDLNVSVISPAGTVHTVHKNTGGSSDDIVETYTVNTGSEDVKGNWTLKVVDSANYDTGAINSWKLSF
ncbi:proprotein convertase P-domain-containing protein [Veronia nyctiphanis]|uniref:proprotein convertase P-domain-containing protein n=1 Tax=Veronia nyctiphanis TaxID=1278244 RepID=UPI0038B5BACA